MQWLTIPVLSPKVYLLIQGIGILYMISGAFAQSLPPPVPTPGSTSEQEQPSKGNGNQTSTDQGNPSQESMPPVKAVPSQETAHISKQISESKSHETTANWWTAVGTCALAVVALVQMLITSFFLYHTLAVTTQAADAAKKSAETAGQALHLTQRAYLIMWEWELTLDGASHDAFRHVPFDIMNVGHTPAMQIEICMDSLVASSLPALPRYEHPSPLENLPPAVLLSYTWPQDLPTSIPEGTFLWIWGCITYHDVFGKQH
jgi:hypothetical protein